MTFEETLLHLKIDGWCLIEDVIPQKKVDEIRQSVEETTYTEGVHTGIEGVATRKGFC